MDLGDPPLNILNMLESDPLKSTPSVRVLAVRAVRITGFDRTGFSQVPALRNIAARMAAVMWPRAKQYLVLGYNVGEATHHRVDGVVPVNGSMQGPSLRPRKHSTSTRLRDGVLPWRAGYPLS